MDKNTNICLYYSFLQDKKQVCTKAYRRLLSLENIANLVVLLIICHLC